MTARSRTSEIQDVKQRAPYGQALISYEIQALINQWERSQQSGECTPDFFIIRCVKAVLEVFTRRQIAELIDHAKPYMQRAGEIAPNKSK